MRARPTVTPTVVPDYTDRVLKPVVSSQQAQTIRQRETTLTSRSWFAAAATSAVGCAGGIFFILAGVTTTGHVLGSDMIAGVSAAIGGGVLSVAELGGSRALLTRRRRRFRRSITGLPEARLISWLGHRYNMTLAEIDGDPEFYESRRRLIEFTAHEQPIGRSLRFKDAKGISHLLTSDQDGFEITRSDDQTLLLPRTGNVEFIPAAVLPAAEQALLTETQNLAGRLDWFYSDMNPEQRRTVDRAKETINEVLRIARHLRTARDESVREQGQRALGDSLRLALTSMREVEDAVALDATAAAETLKTYLTDATGKRAIALPVAED